MDDVYCHFRTCDRASLTRHRKQQHGYIPQPRSARVTVQVQVGSHIPSSVTSTASTSSHLPPLSSSLPTPGPSSHWHPHSHTFSPSNFSGEIGVSFTGIPSMSYLQGPHWQSTPIPEGPDFSGSYVDGKLKSNFPLGIPTNI